MNADFEDLYLQSEQAIKEGDLIRAKSLIEQMLMEDPRSAIAHNSMGWFYRVQFEDYEKAEKHYKAALRFNPNYPHAYWNYAYMLMDLERFADLERLMDRAGRVPAINKAMVYNQLGEMREVQGDFAEAIHWYKEAIRRSVKNDQIETYWDNIERCEEKLAMDAPPEEASGEGAPPASGARAPRRDRRQRLRGSGGFFDGVSRPAPGPADTGPEDGDPDDLFDNPFDDLFDDDPAGRGPSGNGR
jgi:tetratricopeptide (TPR) repeat protein